MFISLSTLVLIIVVVWLMNAWNDAGRDPRISRAYGERERKRAAKAAAKAQASAACLAKVRAANARYYASLDALKAGEDAAPVPARP